MYLYYTTYSIVLKPQKVGEVEVPFPHHDSGVPLAQFAHHNFIHLPNLSRISNA